MSFSPILVVPFSYTALLERFTEIDALPKADREVLLTLIDAFIKKRRFEELAAS
jgi:hypothetical protein